MKYTLTCLFKLPLELIAVDIAFGGIQPRRHLNCTMFFPVTGPWNSNIETGALMCFLGVVDESFSLHSNILRLRTSNN
jgi:hypothetical protein